MTKHADTTQKHLHVASQTVADAAARTALEATLVTGQISMQVYQEDTNVLYVCIAAATLAALSTLITLDDHLHAGVAGDGNQLEAVNTLLATGDTAHHMLVAKGDNAVEIVDPAVTYYSWFDITFAAEGTVEVATGALRYYAPCALTIDKVYISVNTAPTGASLIVDIHKDGVTIFTAQAGRPEIAIAGFSDESATPDIQVLAKNSYLQCDIDQVGSTIAGADLTVHVRCINFLQID